MSVYFIVSRSAEIKLFCLVGTLNRGAIIRTYYSYEGQDITSLCISVWSLWMRCWEKLKIYHAVYYDAKWSLSWGDNNLSPHVACIIPSYICCNFIMGFSFYCAMLCRCYLPYITLTLSILCDARGVKQKAAVICKIHHQDDIYLIIYVTCPEKTRGIYSGE